MKAKEVMSLENKFDKATERARIKKKHREENEDDESSEGQTEEQVEGKQGKRKLTVFKKIVHKKMSTEEEDDVMETGLSLGDA